MLSCTFQNPQSVAHSVCPDFLVLASEKDRVVCAYSHFTQTQNPQFGVHKGMRQKLTRADKEEKQFFVFVLKNYWVSYRIVENVESGRRPCFRDNAANPVLEPA